ncbi:MAG: metalloregulator ArsR/SmtB family transcription factor [Succinivibrio sp.]|jgi:ArsR family transcriptional regulator|nr:metalloregulator ArsR/SmtB family transcription factor [Succinivibrio sp.]
MAIKGDKDDSLSCEELEQLNSKMLPQDDVEMISEFFKALADPTRISIVDALEHHEWLCVSDLASLLGLTKSAVSHQLTNMRLNKLVRVKRDGKRVFYALNDLHVEKVFAMAVTHIHE